MLILVGKSPTTIARDYPHPNVGILISPRRSTDAPTAARNSLPWAADNDCFNGGLNKDLFVKMLKRSRPSIGGCMWVASPDVVADADATLDLFDEWVDVISGQYGYPIALVAQDGMIGAEVRWLEIDALFIGGSTEWKMSEAAHRLVREAQSHGKLVHMGRVNTRRRLELAKAWGVDSVDGTSTVMYTDTYLPGQLEQAAGGRQTLLDWR